MLIDPDGQPVLGYGGGGRVPALDRAALATGRPTVSDVLPTAAATGPNFAIAVPIRTSEDTKSGWVVELEPGGALIEEVVQAQHAGPGMIISVLDSQGAVLAHEPSPPTHLGEPVSPALRTRLLREAEGVLPDTAFDGVEVIAAFARVPGATWHVDVGVPRAQVEGRRTRAALMGLAAGIGLLVVGLVLAGMIARRILRPIARLQALAAQPDIAEPPAATGLAEADAVARALYDSARARQAALTEVRALAETLERRVAEAVAEREQALARAMQAERMQALGRLAGGIAHDLNNVLQIVDTTASLLAWQVGDSPEIKRKTHLLADAVRRGRAITGRLLAFARAPTPAAAAEAVAVGALLEGMLELLAATLGPAISVELDVPPGLPGVNCDRGQLETVLVNLATNARDAMPTGGRLRLEARCNPPEVRPPAALVAGLPAGRYVRIAVTDTGTGMDAETLARVQAPFFTTKPPGEGTGLGLALARGFCEQCAGALTIESVAGSGTTVTLWLPAAP